MGVMNVSLGAKTFGETATKATSATDMAQTVSALDAGKLNNEDMGSTLNKIADPNWIDPSKKVRTTGNDKLDKDAFFKLMLAQMKNQDPTNPMKSHETAAQLATFSQLEQMQNMNTTLTDMKNGQKPNEQFQMLSLIGKAVAGDSAKVIHSNADRDHDFRFNLPTDSSEVEIKITNADGAEVRKYNLKSLKKGDNKITWNSLDEKGMKILPGEYNFSIEAKDGGGKKMAIKTDFEGVISGVNYTPEGPVLLVGNQTIRMRDVKKITDPSLLKNDQKINHVNDQDLSKNENKVEMTKEGMASAEQSPAVKSKVLDQVGLSRDMLNKLAKETSLK